MKIEVLGSSAAWPIPRIGCDCPQCAEARRDPARRRSRTGILVTEGPTELWIDASMDVYGQLARTDRGAPGDILLSHAHEDHCQGLGDAHHSPYRGARTLHGHATVLEIMRARHPYLFEGRKGFRANALEPGETAAIGELRVTGFDVHHSPGQGFTTLGLFLEGTGARVFVATDFKSLDPPDLARAADADLWLMDGSGLDQAFPTHAPMREIQALRAEQGGGGLAFTHIGHIRRSIAELREALGPPGDPWIARDGTVFEVRDHAVTATDAD